jgi:amidase
LPPTNAKMSVFSVTPRDGNPVTLDVLDKVCDSIGVSLKNAEKDDYRKLLAVFHESAEQLMAMPDEAPDAHLERFPRQNVRFPEASENLHGAWAWRCDIQDDNTGGEGLLKGKSVVIKDNIAVKDVPMLLGTAMIKDYIPVSPNPKRNP